MQWATQMLDKYRLGKVIGTGAFGTIRLAQSKETSDTFAVKVLSKARPGQSRQRTATKLLREACCMSVVQECEGVVQLKGLFEDMNSAYFVMERCTGGDLEQLVQNHGRLTEHQAAVVLFEVLLMVKACHRVGVCHGDIKPANFLMSRQLPQSLHTMSPGDRAPDPGWLKAIDFGCAQQVPPDKYLSRRTGTPVYMAPEVFKRKYRCQADMWSLGMLMYHLLSGRFPYWDNMQQCKASSLNEVMDAVANKPIVTDIPAFTSTSSEAMSLMASLLNREPGRRLTAEAALEHSYFKMHLGWQAEEPRLLQKVLPELVSCWHSQSQSPPTAAASAVESPQQQQGRPEGAPGGCASGGTRSLRMPGDLASAGDASSDPALILANNVVEYSSTTSSAARKGNIRLGSPSRASPGPTQQVANRANRRPSTTKHTGRKGQQQQQQVGGPPHRRQVADLQPAFGA